jgi:uncharacterized protein (TIGR03790 family)
LTGGQLRALALGAFAATAGAQGPENVLVVVNRNVPASGRIADYYAARRRIPPSNICPIPAPAVEEVARAEYVAAVEKPVAACLESRGLAERILYIATTLGVPLKIRGRLGRDGDAASVDSELALLYSKRQGRETPLEGPAPNPFYRQRDTPFTHPRFPIYLVTRLAAFDEATVRAMIDRSLAAANRGRFVLDAKSAEDRSGDEWLRTAALLLPAERVLLEETPKVVEGVRDVIGYASWGSNDPGRRRRRLGFGWLPGAIMTEYVSTNGRTLAGPPADWELGVWRDRKTYFAGSPQTLATDYLEEGATGAAGHVYEPYLAYSPRPDVLFPAYFSGRTLAESYYLAIPALSWMTVVLGDPLCRLSGAERRR